MFAVNIALGIFILEGLILVEGDFLHGSWYDASIPLTVILVFGVLLFFVHSVVLTFVSISLSVLYCIYVAKELIGFGEDMAERQWRLEEMQATTKEEYEALERQRKEAEITNSNGVKAKIWKGFVGFCFFLVAILLTAVFGWVFLFDRPGAFSLDTV